jgi:hypothetical protein
MMLEGEVSKDFSTMETQLQTKIFLQVREFWLYACTASVLKCYDLPFFRFLN